MIYSYLKEDNGIVYYRGYDDNNEPVLRKDKNFKPVCYTLANNPKKTSSLKSYISDEKLSLQSYDSLKAYKTSIDEFKSMSVPIYGVLDNGDIIHQYIRENELGGEGKDFSPINGYFFDIETLSPKLFPKAQDAHYPVSAICMIDRRTHKGHLWALHDKKLIDADQVVFRKIRMFKKRYPIYAKFKSYDEISNQITKEKNKLIKDTETDNKAKIKDLDKAFEYMTFTRNLTVEILESDDEILNRWVKFVHETKPDFLSGWNTSVYDLPYLFKRMENIFGFKELYRMLEAMSPFGKFKEKHVKDIKGNPLKSYEIFGVADIDYMLVYQKYCGHNSPSWALDYISNEELGHSKLEHEDSFWDFYKRDPQMYFEYNIVDTDLVYQLDKKLNFLNVAFTMTHMCYMPLDNFEFNSFLWDGYLSEDLFKDGLIIPPKSKLAKRQIEGAYNMQPRAAKYKHIISYDLNSLYPHLIMQYNISPETFVPLEKISDKRLLKYSRMASEKTSVCEPENHSMGVDLTLEQGVIDYDYISSQNLIMTPCGAFFRKDIKGRAPIIMERIYNDRKKHQAIMKGLYEQAEKEKDLDKKKELLLQAEKANTMQYTLKIFLNSFYGVFLADGFRYYNPAIGASITSAGQLSIRFIIGWINDFLNDMIGTEKKNFVIASSTDSMYINFDPIVKRKFKGDMSNLKERIDWLIDLSDNTVAKELTRGYEYLSDMVHAYENKMKMGREVIADVGFWLDKRRYALRVYSDDKVKLYSKPKVKIVGHQIVKGDTPKCVKPAMRAIIEMVLNGETGENIRKYMYNFKKQYMQLSYRDIAISKTVTDILKFQKSSASLKKDKKVTRVVTSAIQTVHTYKEESEGATPVHSKGCIIFNNLVKMYKLGDDEIIAEGQKVKFLYLKKPNTAQNAPCICFMNKIPKEFKLEPFVDFNKMYDVTFENKMLSDLERLGL